MDVMFYSNNEEHLQGLECVKVLPEFTNNSGYTDIDVKIEAQGGGDFELHFYDEELKNIIRSRAEKGLFVKWGNFEGFTTGYRFSFDDNIIYGKHLNAWAEQYTFRRSSTLNSYPYDMLNLNLSNAFASDFSQQTTDHTEYTSDDRFVFTLERSNGDVFFDKFLPLAKSCYMASIDFENLKINFKIFKPKINPNIPLLDESNVFVSNITEEFDGKTFKNVGYWKNTSDVWSSVNVGSPPYWLMREAIIEDVSTQLSALSELKTHKATTTITAELQGYKYGTDLNIGDKIRIPINGTVYEKTITGVRMWANSSGYGEEFEIGDIRTQESEAVV